MATSTEGRANPAPITDADLVHWFTYHPPREGQSARYEVLRAQGLVLARMIHGLTPPGDDQDASIRHVRDAIMTANAAIACEDEAHRESYAQKFDLRIDDEGDIIRREDPK